MREYYAYKPENGTLICAKCGERKPLSGFYRDRTWHSGYDRRCKVCQGARAKKYLASLTPEQKERKRVAHLARCRRPDVKLKAAAFIRSERGKKVRMVQCAKLRAEAKGVPFAITADDIAMPAVCPLLGVPITPGRGKMHANSPSLDRIRPELGYVPGNVIVVSFRANAIKQNATPDELELIARNLRALLDGT